MIGAKPKVDPTTERMNPLYDKLDHAIDLLNCAYYATEARLASLADIADPVRATMDDAIVVIREVKSALHDMIAWAE